MSSSNGTCEIEEVKDNSSSIQNSSRFRPTRMLPSLKNETNRSSENDINKLFEAFDFRTSKSLDLSDRGFSNRNASKKPMRGGGAQSPGCGFSEPLSLKQALRGLSISHAAEMAATKRLSKSPTSPSISEAGKLSSSYRSLEIGDSQFPLSKVPQYILHPKSKSANHSVQSSPRFVRKPSITVVDCTPHPTEVEIQSTSVQQWTENEDGVLYLPLGDTKEGPSVKKKGTKSPSRNVGTSVRVTTKHSPKLRRKGRLQTLQSSSVTKGKTDRKLIKSTSAAKKTVKSASETVGGVGLTTQLICQRCQCHLNEPNLDTPEEVIPVRQNNVEDKFVLVSDGCNGVTTPPVKPENMSNSREQGELSQSSKSSIGAYSSSTTISDQSNLSGFSPGNRPHMSKDYRWEAINNVKKQHGFLGLGNFNLLKKLGSGDIGTVYLAELIGASCLFAIKVMDNEFLVRRRKMGRAQTEREILRMLDHPFLPTLFAQFTSDNLSCVVMEFCPGGDLHVLRQKQPGRYFSEQAARFYVAEVLLALEYLHMLGIVYRDLKPENIMVREDGHIMLTDFDLSLRCSVNPTLVKSPLALEPPRMSGPCAGSSCIDPFCAEPSCKVSCFIPRFHPAAARARKQKAEIDAQNRSLPQLVAEPTEARSNSFVGTHEYLAPEIIKGEGHGSAVDWWTLGVFLYELLYGKTPFKGSGNEETLANVVLQSLRFPDSPMISVQARDLIRGLLVKDPRNRLGTETGAAEIKRHSFFEGLNWALIRCATPPEVPELFELSDEGVQEMVHQSEGSKFVECTEERVEFELF